MVWEEERSWQQELVELHQETGRGLLQLELEELHQENERGQDDLILGDLLQETGPGHLLQDFGLIWIQMKEMYCSHKYFGLVLGPWSLESRDLLLGLRSLYPWLLLS